VGLVGLVAAVITGGCLPEGNGPPAAAPSSEPSTTTSVAAVPSSGGLTTTAAMSEPPAALAPAPDGQGGEAESAVRSVTDGDTLVLADGRRVRLAQVDAPETGACFGSQSTQALRALVEGREVTVRRPENGPERDRYGRTLGEVSVSGTSVNEELVRSGAAAWYQEFAHEDTGLAARLRAAEIEAKKAKIGQWSTCTSPTSSAAAAPPSTQALVPGSTCHPAYPVGCIPPGPPDLDCGDIRRRVQVDHAHGDPHRLDADSDGWGCETSG
jgi:micrococcal nuclease